MALKFLGEETIKVRDFPTAESVTQDDRGLKQLIHAGCLHAAVNLTSRLLTVYGQGEGCVGQKSKHTRHSIRVSRTAMLLIISNLINCLSKTSFREFTYYSVHCNK